MRNADQPAYPHLLKAGDVAKSEGGLSKREYFAALAMQSIIASKHEEIKWWPEDIKQQSFAKSAVAYADILLAELERTGGGS